MAKNASKQLLHLVFGGELVSTEGIEFKDVCKLDVVGIYPNFADARAAWAAASRLCRGVAIRCTAWLRNAGWSGLGVSSAPDRNAASTGCGTSMR